MTDVAIEDRGSTQILHLSGELVVRHTDRLFSGLVAALGGAERVEIDLSSVTDVDISCLQLLCAAHKTSIRQHKPLRVEGPCPDVFRRALNNAGYLRRTGCVLGTSHACLWNGVTYG